MEFFGIQVDFEYRSPTETAQFGRCCDSLQLLIGSVEKKKVLADRWCSMRRLDGRIHGGLSRRRHLK